MATGVKASKIDTSVGRAPDSVRKGVTRGRREQITLTITPNLLATVDQLVAKTGQSRAALINRAICELTERVRS